MLAILFIFFLSASFGLCNIQLGIVGQAAAQDTATATWSRSPTDPQISALAKVKLDESPALTSPPFAINTPGAVAGELPLPFNRAGIFHLIALDANKQVISTSDEFGVNPPGIFVSQSDTGIATGLESQTEISTPETPTPSVQLMSGKPTSSPPAQRPSKGKTQTPAIVGAVLGVVFALLLAVVVFVVLRNRGIHKRQASLRQDMIARLPSYNFGTIVSPARSYPVQSADPEKMGAESPMSDFSYRHAYGMSPDNHQPTARQIELDQRISELQTTITSLRNVHDTGSVSSAGNEVKIWRLLNQVESLKRLKASPWALGITDTIPDELA